MKKILNIKNSTTTLLLTVIIFLICTSERKLTGKVDFTGTWVINIQKSDLHGFPHFTANRQLKVSQQASEIIIERSYFKAEGLDSMIVDRDVLLFNGTPYYTKTADKRQKAAIASWTVDGNSLVIQSKFSAVNDTAKTAFNEEYHNKETWSLSTDKTTLTIDKNVQDVDGSGYSIRAVYDKQ